MNKQEPQALLDEWRSQTDHREATRLALAKYPDILKTFIAQSEDNERLTEQVKAAYLEGHNRGRGNPPIYQSALEDWTESRARATLKENDR